VLENHHISAVVHFAANAAVAESMRDPYRYLHANVVNSLAGVY
jgi:UDP-glucose 4-epimerase